MTAQRRASRPAGAPSVAPKPAPPSHKLLLVAQAPPAQLSVDLPAAALKPAVKTARRAGRLRANAQLGRARSKRRPVLLPQRTIVFVGPMAAGKTSLGRRVAKELGVPFFDSDVLFVRQHGQVADFFARHGEAEFRKIEEQIIRDELQQSGARVLALGGGAVLSAATRQLLSDYPTVLLMTTQQAVLRTANLAKRPLLRDDPEAWGRILSARKHLYNEVADVTFRTDRMTMEQLTARVVSWLSRYARSERVSDSSAAGES